MLEVRQLAGVIQHAQMAVLIINRYARFIRMVNIVNEGSHKAVYGILRHFVLLLQALLISGELQRMLLMLTALILTRS